ncbi:MAG: tetratricopeptide repeat protein [Prevotella sp.]|nr:tetratricopeptide repeat protein [Prevotella sp.]
MKRIMTIMALICAVAFQVNAQTTNVEDLLKTIEQKVKQADKHPKDGKMQLTAAYAILSDSLSGNRDWDRALNYANRAMKIAVEHPAPQDTLLGLSYEALGMIYLGKEDMATALDFYEMAMDAFDVELGRFDPVTNGTKLIYGWLMTAAQPSRGFPKILEAIYDNERAPQDKRIKNMDQANITLEAALEMLLAEQTQRFRYALPMLYIDGKKYFIVQTSKWNIERPIVGWMAQGLMPSEAKDDAAKDDDSILIGDDGQFLVLTEADKDKRQMLFNFNYSRLNRHYLQFNDGEARIMFFSPDVYNQILTKYREFKNNK